MKKMRSSARPGYKRRGKIPMTLGLLLMAAALFLACMNFLEAEEGGEAARSVLNQLDQMIPPAADQPTVRSLSVASAAGEEIAWPMDENGAPMPWPVDKSGEPCAAYTDGSGSRFEWKFGSPAEWTRTSDGILPFVRDAQGGLTAWPVDASGSALSWEAIRHAWAGLISGLSDWLEQQPAFLLSPQMDMPVQKIDGRYYIGVLEVPSRKIRLPIMADWNETDLKISPCRYAGSAYTGDLVIAGHNYYRHFSPIKYLAVGTEVRFIDVDGHVFEYEVISSQTIEEEDVAGMLAGSWDLTLFTCTTGGERRIAIRCRGGYAGG